jgi:hypothetical protein
VLQEISELEGRTNDDMIFIELPSHETAAIAPVEQAFTRALADPVELCGEPTQVCEPER